MQCLWQTQLQRSFLTHIEVPLVFLCFPFMYNVEKGSFRQMQEMQSYRCQQRLHLHATRCMRKSHIHITPGLLPPVIKQPLNNSISALAVGPPGHLASILSVISLTDEWPYSPFTTGTRQPQLRIHPYPHCRLPPHLYAPEEAEHLSPSS